MPALPAIEKRQAPDDSLDSLAQVVNAFIGAVVDGIRPLLASPRARSVNTPQTLTGAADTVCNHKLGVKPQGWLFLRPNAAATVYEVSLTDTTITLHASATVTGFLEVW